MFEPRIDPPEKFRGRNVTVMGLGLFGGGEGVIRFLTELGANVTVTDKRSAQTLAPSLKKLGNLAVKWVLGEHREEDFTNADLVIPSPAVPRDSPFLQLCIRQSIPLDTEMNLFFKYCRAKIAAVTGTNGKTTTTTLLGTLASSAWPKTRVGGNLGKSLLPNVFEIGSDEWVVLELSSFQLEDLQRLDRRPEVSVVTNVSPNHLDRHGTYESYLEAKKNLLAPNRSASDTSVDVAILNGEDSILRTWSRLRPKTLFFGRTGNVRPRANGVWIDSEAGEVYLKLGEKTTHLFRTDDLALPGTFNLLNAAAAAGAAAAMGAPCAGFASAVRSFRTVEHRLEPFYEVNGIRFFNDSIATTPESTIAALDTLGPKVVLVCGGAGSADRSYVTLGRAISRGTRYVILIGKTAREIRKAIPQRYRGPEVRIAKTFEEAVTIACEQATPGDNVLLSPASASYDMFVNYVERGNRFKALVRNATLGVDQVTRAT
ncbi:MAG: UDP-N-acetylmuramoyl-L-alanine--D-glutamate ligase [Planctomycetes bacterium]|nr:UDP-N-acetylmuramoyl-L-alanine--D-glutamate ligase [Planctomycetota bacterium]